MTVYDLNEDLPGQGPAELSTKHMLDPLPAQVIHVPLGHADLPAPFPHPLRVLGDLLTTQSPVDPERAAVSYREALFLAKELEMRPLVAHCQLGLGKLYRRTGKRQEAREHLVTAKTMYREMDMRFWLEQAEAEMAELR